MSRTDQRKQETRRKLLRGALEVFSEKGLDGARVQSVTDAAGLGFGSFYNYFDSLEDAWRAVIDEYIERAFDELDAAAAAVEAPDERIADICLYMLEAVVQRPILGRLILQVVGRWNVRTLTAPIRLGRDIGDGMRAGVFAADDIVASAIMLAGGTLAFLAASLDGMIEGDVGRRLARVFLVGLGVAPERATELAARPKPDWNLPSLARLS